MRWKHKTQRIIKRFAFLPITVEAETRWLETVYIEQIYNEYYLLNPWIDSHFVTKEDYEAYKKEQK